MGKKWTLDAYFPKRHHNIIKAGDSRATRTLVLLMGGPFSDIIKVLINTHFHMIGAIADPAWVAAPPRQSCRSSYASAELN